MRLRRSARPSTVALGPPRPDGGGWPAAAVAGRPSFASATLHEMALRAAYEPEAHAVADRIVDDVLPRVVLDVDEQDRPHLQRVLLTASRIGAGLGIVVRGGSLHERVREVERDVAAALWEARRKQPAMQPAWEVVAAYFLLAGFLVARGGPDVVDELVHDLG